MRVEAISAEEAVCVSVVIPTRNRADLLEKAIASALRQDFENLEVIVVVDGEDPLTRNALGRCDDERLQVIELPVSIGGAEARNVGVRAARGTWVAFLDDDDEWLPHKLSLQMATARQSSAAWPVVSSRLIVRALNYEVVRPLRSYKVHKPVSEYLFCRRSFKDGPYAMQTSTMLAPRELMLAVPFCSGLKRHQDWDWVLRAEQAFGVDLVIVDEPLVVYSAEDGRESIGREQDWAFSMQWGREMRGYFTAKAYGWFLASECASRAVKSRAGWKVYAAIVRRFMVDGQLTVGSAVTMAVFLALPKGLRQRVHRLARLWRSRDGSVMTEVGCRAIREARGSEA